MPDKYGRFNDAEVKALARRITAHGPISCPVCHSIDWEVSDQYVAMPAVGAGGGMDLGRIHTHAKLTSSCGYVLMFDVKKLGITSLTETIT